MQYSLKLVVVLLAYGTIACGQADVPTQQSNAPLPSQERLEKKPELPGRSVVFRMKDVLLTYSTDPQRDLIAWHMSAENWTACGGTEDFPLADVQYIESPKGALHVNGKYREIPVYVYRLSEWNTLRDHEVCDYLAHNWLYRGTHTMVVTSNDIIQEGSGASTLGWSAHGTVQDPEGNRYRYTEQQRGIAEVAQDTGAIVVDWMTENIRVHRIGR